MILQAIVLSTLEKGAYDFQNCHKIPFGSSSLILVKLLSINSLGTLCAGNALDMSFQLGVH